MIRSGEWGIQKNSFQISEESPEMIIKPRLFIGSALEDDKRGVLSRFQSGLQPVASVTPWTELPEFKRETTNYDALVKATNSFDFGLFVFSATDTLTIRDATKVTARDNVHIEFGMFVGAIGPSRVMGAVEDNRATRTPSDLAGVIMPHFDTTNEESMRQSIGDICNDFKVRIEHHGRRRLFLKLATSWYYDLVRNEFRLVIDPYRLSYYEPVIGSYNLMIAARIENDLIDRYEDASIVKSALRKPRGETIEFAVSGSKLPGLGAGKTVEASILLAPNGTDPQKYSSLEQLEREAGCRIADKVSFTIGEACGYASCPLARNAPTH